MFDSLDSFSLTLQQQLNPFIHQLAGSILDCWQKYFELSDYYLPEEFSYIEGEWEREALTIENCCYQTSHFRKLHLELAKVGPNLDILHCVMFPRPEYTLPMFGCDIVVGRGQTSAAIADLSPLNPERKLSAPYHHALGNLQPLEFSQYRELPEWADIFSEFCLFIRPNNEHEEEQFILRVKEFLEIHCNYAQTVKAVSAHQQSLNRAGQHYYCQQQQQNDKTRRVLEKAFGSQWTERYLTLVLFDRPET